MVAVVEGPGQDGLEAVEGAAADPELFHPAVIVAREGHDAAHVVVDEADVQALRGLFLQYLQDGVPHEPGLHDEVFEEDIAFCAAQLLEHCGEELVPEFIVGGLCPGKDGRAGAALEVCGLERGLGLLVEQGLALGGDEAGRLPVAQEHPGELLALTFRGALPAEEYVRRDSHQGQEHDGQDPGYLEGRAAVLVDYIYHRDQRERHEHRLHRGEAALEIEQRGEEHGQLQQHEERDERQPREQEFQQLFHRDLPTFPI